MIIKRVINHKYKLLIISYLANETNGLMKFTPAIIWKNLESNTYKLQKICAPGCRMI